MGYTRGTRSNRLPTRRARKRGQGQVAIVRGAAAVPAGPVLRSQTGQIAIPLSASGPWSWLGRGLWLIAVAALAGLYVGWRFSEQILAWLEQALSFVW